MRTAAQLIAQSQKWHGTSVLHTCQLARSEVLQSAFRRVCMHQATYSWLREPSVSPGGNQGLCTAAGRPGGLQRVKHVIAVSSCKGGVGKSTTAVNLAYTLLQVPGLGVSVCVDDSGCYLLWKRLAHVAALPCCTAAVRKPCARRPLHSKGTSWLQDVPIRKQGCHLLSLGTLQMGGRVGILDADVHGPSLPTMISPQPRVMIMDPATRVRPLGAWLPALFPNEVTLGASSCCAISVAAHGNGWHSWQAGQLTAS